MCVRQWELLTPETVWVGLGIARVCLELNAQHTATAYAARGGELLR